MGITKLAALIRSEAPCAISHKDISDFAGNIPDFCTSLSFVKGRYSSDRLFDVKRRLLIADVSIQSPDY